VSGLSPAKRRASKRLVILRRTCSTEDGSDVVPGTRLVWQTSIPSRHHIETIRWLCKRFSAPTGASTSRCRVRTSYTTPPVAQRKRLPARIRVFAASCSPPQTSVLPASWRHAAPILRCGSFTRWSFERARPRWRSVREAVNGDRRRLHHTTGFVDDPARSPRAPPAHVARRVRQRLPAPPPTLANLSSAASFGS